MGIPTVYTGDDVKPKGTLVTRKEGGVSQQAKNGQSYAYTLDSAQTTALTFRLLRRGVPLYRDLASALIRIPRGAVTKQVVGMARDLDVSLARTSGAPSGERLKMPSIGVFGGTGVSTTAGSFGEVRYIAEQRWNTGVTVITESDVNGNSNAFRELKVLIVPDGSSSTGGLTATGLTNLRDWVAAGRIYIGIRRQGTRMARSALMTTTTEKPAPPGYQVLGSNFRVDVNHASPVALGRPAEDFQFNNSDPILNPSTTGVNVATYPTDSRFWYNGYAVGTDALKGTVVVVDEPVGSGRAILFSYDALFRAYEESGEEMIANAVLYPIAPGIVTARAAGAMQVNLTSPLGRERAEAAQAASRENPLLSDWRPLTIRVPADQADRASAVVAGFTDDAVLQADGATTLVVVPNPDGLLPDEHPFARELVAALRRSNVRLISIGL